MKTSHSPKEQDLIDFRLLINPQVDLGLQLQRAVWFSFCQDVIPAWARLEEIEIDLSEFAGWI